MLWLRQVRDNHYIAPKLLKGTKQGYMTLMAQGGYQDFILFCLFDLILYVPSTIFQLYRDGSSWVEPVLS